MAVPSERHRPFDPRQDAVRVRHVHVLEGVRERRVETRAPDDGAVEVLDRLLRDDRADLRAVPSVRGASYTTTARPVRFTESRIAFASSGTRVRRSTTSASTFFSLAARSAASSATFTMY